MAGVVTHAGHDDGDVLRTVDVAEPDRDPPGAGQIEGQQPCRHAAIRQHGQGPLSALRDGEHRPEERRPGQLERDGRQGAGEPVALGPELGQ